MKPPRQNHNAAAVLCRSPLAGDEGGSSTDHVLKRLQAGSCLSLAAVFLVVGLASGRALDVSEWKSRQTLAVDRAGIVKLALPPATLDAARAGLEDLRLLDPAGREIAFVIERPVPVTSPATRIPKSFRASLADAGATQLLIDAGSPVPLAAVTLTTPAVGFLKAARVEISSDGETWETITTGAVVFRQFGADQLRLELGGHLASQVRITLDDTRTRPVPFTGATLWLVPATLPAPTLPLPVRIVRREEFAGESVLTIDLGAAHVPMAALEFATTESLFTRNVTFTTREFQDETAVEKTLATGVIWRVAAEGLPPSAHLEVPVNFAAPSRELLVHLANGDSPPLTLDELRARQQPVYLVFRAAEAGAFTVLTGNVQTVAPHYDLVALAPALREAAPGALMPGSIELNPAYRQPETLADTPLAGAPINVAPWAFRKRVNLTAGGVHQLELDLEVLAHAQPDFADLRLVLDGQQIPYLLERPNLSRSVPVVVTPANDPQRPRFSRWELKLPLAGLPVKQLTLTSPTVLFQRHLRLSEKIADERNGVIERVVAEADWRKVPGSDQRATLNFYAPPGSATWVLETDNGDNPPLVISRAETTYSVARVLFKAAGPPLALYYGNPQANAPRYDLALVAGQILAAEKNVALSAPEEKSKADGWTTQVFAGRRGGVVFWGVLALVVVGLLVVVARLLPKPPTPTA